MRHDLQSAADASAPGASFAAFNILIVEENAIIALDLEGILHEAGFKTCVIVSDGEAALRAIQIQDFDAAVVDILVFNEERPELQQALLVKSIPFALCTGHGTKATLALDGTCHILSKPYNPEQIRSVVAELVASKKPCRTTHRASDLAVCL